MTVTHDLKVKDNQGHIITDVQLARQCWCQAPSGALDQILLLSDTSGFVDVALMTTGSDSEPELLNDWLFTTSQDQRPLRPMTRDFFNWTLGVIVFMWHPLWRDDEFASYE
jgi:hypothetical protein